MLLDNKSLRKDPCESFEQTKICFVTLYITVLLYNTTIDPNVKVFMKI